MARRVRLATAAGSCATVSRTAPYLLALVLLALPGPSRSLQAACVCGFDDGMPTLATITLDGAFTDWAAVMADTDNNVCDGYPGSDPPDGDTPSSTGRDLTQLAFTWDDDNLYLYTVRWDAGSTTNTQNFVYYADMDNDGYMQDGEPVICASWQGNTGQVSLYLGEYSAYDTLAGADSMVSPAGSGDGYSLPGTIDNIAKDPYDSGTFGSPDGTTMELYVPWALLGVPAGTPHSIHSSAVNANFGAASLPGQVDDNMGGCGGGGGTLRFADLLFVADQALQGNRGQTVVAPHTVTNLGNLEDTFALTTSIGGDHTPSCAYYLDADGSGTLNSGDSPLGDSDGDGLPDTGPLAVDASADLLIAYTIASVSAYDPAGTALAVTSAHSTFNTLVRDEVTDSVWVISAPQLVVLKSVQAHSDPFGGGNPKAIPGAVVTYTVNVTNLGDRPTDAGSVRITDAVPANAALVVSDIGTAGGGAAPLQRRCRSQRPELQLHLPGQRWRQPLLLQRRRRRLQLFARPRDGRYRPRSNPPDGEPFRGAVRGQPPAGRPAGVHHPVSREDPVTCCHFDNGKERGETQTSRRFGGTLRKGEEP